jgi:glutamate-ammonia-ligase adenylyltransferase
MGKHGAHELNYSSDIDLIVLYDPQRAQTYLKGDVAPFFVWLTQAMVRLLQERTADGYVLRVDLRLRPDPGSTAVAISFHAACDYYELLGQNWERAAMIKARAVAGDCRAGEDFLRLLAPFIWRKYFDYAAIADIHAMKRQIHAVRGHETIKVIGHDIKFGRGGIREIEFFVQTQQLIFGGRRTSLRGAKTLDMLPALHEEGWITKAACDELTKAYIELRRIEHRLQMIRDEQTQRLPGDTKQLLSLAQFCGFRTSAAFTRHMLKIFNCVEYHYARLFESAPTLDSQQGSLVFTGVVDDPETLSTLN